MQIDKSWLTGRFDPRERFDFSEVPLELCDEVGHYLYRDALEAWVKLHIAAKEDGIFLQIISSTRNFERQKRIWENKWQGITLTNGINLSEMNFTAAEKAERILRFSAMPGTSRHHWGTDLDFNSVEPEYFETSKGSEEYNWMKMNAGKFGFAQPYTAKNMKRRFGYEEEKWHWSFLPLSHQLVEAYRDIISYNDISDFAGSELALEIQVIEHYVFGIAKGCLPESMWHKNA
jgi:zinc D-Ala-D-Ala carboxypeptidase